MTIVEAPPVAGAIGTRAVRRDGPRLLTGQARYLADIEAAGLCHAAIARSTVAHARVRSIDVSEAQRMPGVIAVVVQADLDAVGARPFDHLLGPPAKPLRWGILASDRVRHVGEPVAAVVATTRALAEDAVEAIVIDYDELPPVVGVRAALDPGAPLLYPEWGSNEFFGLSYQTPGLEEALADAPRRFAETFESHRVCGLPLEGLGAQASWEAGSERLTLISSNQQPHQLRTVVAEVCGLDETHVRVVSPDMGGGFGNKQHFTREDCLVGLLARITGRTVRWSQDRTEALVASVHSRAQIHEVEVGFDDDGRILVMKVTVLSDLGNPVLYFSGIGPALVTVSSITGAYRVPYLGWHVQCVATTTCPVGAYRGFGQPEAHFTTERVMDRIAEQVGKDPAEVRRLNLIPDGERPWRGHNGQRIDPGPLRPQLDLLLDRFGYREWRRRQGEERAAGRMVGVGLSMLVQGTTPTQNDTAGRFASIEMAEVTVLPDARVSVRVGTKSQGQGHETTVAQVAADALGVHPEQIDVRDGDTDALPYGQGTWGSRSTVMAGGAVLKAVAVLRRRMHDMAAVLGLELPLEGPVDPAVFARVAEVAWWHPHLLPPASELGLSTSAVYTPGYTGPDSEGGSNHDETYGSYASAAAVEVDPATGDVKVLSVLLVSDCGVVINPALVEGQHQGGFAQGLGAAFFEEIRYNDDGQPLCATLMDYTIPAAPDVPVVDVVHRPTPSATLGGFRGVGESSIIIAPALLVGAVADALAPIGVKLTSSRVHAVSLRAAIRHSGWRPDPAAWAAGGDIGHIEIGHR